MRKLLMLLFVLFALPVLPLPTAPLAQAAEEAPASVRMQGEWQIDLPPQEATQLTALRLALEEPPPSEAELSLLRPEVRELVGMLVPQLQANPAMRSEMQAAVDLAESMRMEITADTLQLRAGSDTQSRSYSVQSQTESVVVLDVVEDWGTSHPEVRLVSDDHMELWENGAMALTATRVVAGEVAASVRMRGVWKVVPGPEEAGAIELLRMAVRDEPPTQADIATLPAELQEQAAGLHSYLHSSPDDLAEARGHLATADDMRLTITADTMDMVAGTQSTRAKYRVARETEGSVFFESLEVGDDGKGEIRFLNPDHIQLWEGETLIMEAHRQDAAEVVGLDAGRLHGSWKLMPVGEEAAMLEALRLGLGEESPTPEQLAALDPEMLEVVTNLIDLAAMDPELVEESQAALAMMEDMRLVVTAEALDIHAGDQHEHMSYRVTHQTESAVFLAHGDGATQETEYRFLTLDHLQILEEGEVVMEATRLP